MVYAPKLDSSLEEPLYRQLFKYFADLIRSGDLPAGERLPATRELAGQLRVNRTTVSAAYELLESENLISGHVGRGSFVCGTPSGPDADWLGLVRRVPGLGTRPPATSAQISFAASRPPEELFPVDDFRESCDEVLGSSLLGNILQLGSPGGYDPLRQYLLAQAREEGVLGPHDDLLITNGCQQALDLLRRVLLRNGVRVAVEDPVYPGLRNLFREGGAELIGIPFRADGWNVGEMVQARAQLAVITPNFQNPTGLSLGLEARQAILRQARDSGTALIENDIYSALRYEGDPLPSIKALAPAAATVLLRSFSKIAFPGLRLGWVIGPRVLIAAMRDAKQLTDLHSDQFSQAVMLRFAESGRLAKHQKNMVVAGAERLCVALQSAREFLPSAAHFTRPQGGFNFWVSLPRDLDAGELLDGAQARGVTYLPGSYFSVTRSCANALRLSFGGLRPELIRRGISVLGEVFKDAGKSGRQFEREFAPALV